MEFIEFRYKSHRWKIYKHKQKVYNYIIGAEHTQAITILKEQQIHILDKKESFTLNTLLHELFHMAFYYKQMEHYYQTNDLEEIAAEVFCEEGIELVKLGRKLYSKLR